MDPMLRRLPEQHCQNEERQQLRKSQYQRQRCPSKPLLHLRGGCRYRKHLREAPSRRHRPMGSPFRPCQRTSCGWTTPQVSAKRHEQWAKYRGVVSCYLVSVAQASLARDWHRRRVLRLARPYPPIGAPSSDSIAWQPHAPPRSSREDHSFEPNGSLGRVRRPSTSSTDILLRVSVALEEAAEYGFAVGTDTCWSRCRYSLSADLESVGTGRGSGAA